MYTWMEYPNVEMWNKDTFETIEECVEDAKKHYFVESGDVIYIGECKPATIGGIYLDDVLERVEEDMYEQVGDAAYDWDISSTRGPYENRQSIYDKYNKKLEKLVKDYIKEIEEGSKFYTVTNVQEVMVG